MSEDKNFESALNKAQELESMDFTKKDDFNVQEYYTALEKIAKKNENLKNEEAENIVEKEAKELIDSSFIDELKNKRKIVEDFIRKYDPNLESTRGLEIKDVDKVYAISNYLLNSYIQYVNEMRFIFTLEKLEYKFLNKVLMNEIEYNADEVFNFVEFYEKFWKGVQEKVEEDKSTEIYTFTVDIKMLLILHHLIKSHSVKGRTNDFRYFQSILFKIAKINKLFNAYNIIIDRIKSDRELWGNALDEIMREKDPEYMKQMEAQAREAAAKSGQIPTFENLEVHPVIDADLGK
jgi:hypothetical protein